MQESSEEERTLEPGLIDNRDIHGQLLARYQEVKAKDAREVEEAGGADAFVRVHLPLIRTLYPGPWTAEFIAAETLGGWRMAEARLRQCAICPAQGGTCEDAFGDTGPEGKRVVIRPELATEPSTAERPQGSPMVFEPCDKWQVFRYRAAAARSGIPERMLGDTMEYFSALDRHEQASVATEHSKERWSDLRKWIEAARASDPPSFVLTGGSSPTRTALAVAVAKMLVGKYTNKRGVYYTFGPRLAAELRDHFDQEEALRDPLGPMARCEAATVLVFDFCDPAPKTREPWAPWFREKVDLMIWKRLGANKPTILVSPKSLEELWESFECASIYTMLELNVEELGL